MKPLGNYTPLNGDISSTKKALKSVRGLAWFTETQPENMVADYTRCKEGVMKNYYDQVQISASSIQCLKLYSDAESEQHRADYKESIKESSREFRKRIDNTFKDIRANLVNYECDFTHSLDTLKIKDNALLVCRIKNQLVNSLTVISKAERITKQAEIKDN
ncbi:MAG: hypothetical protein ACK4M7_00455 [Burkholderiales bacterium]